MCYAAGVIHDLAAGVACDALHRKLPQARHRDCGLRALLPEPHGPPEHNWCVTLFLLLFSGTQSLLVLPIVTQYTNIFCVRKLSNETWKMLGA